MGVVYLALQVSLERQVALKILSPKLTSDPEAVKQFIAEARAAGRLTHANVVQVHDVGIEDGLCYICMEYIGGGSLTDILSEQGRLDPQTALRVGMDIARGLNFAENQGIVHADIKPDNILLTEEGTAKIADLGLSQKSGEKSGKSGEALGSPHYMSPEQARGETLDFRTDQYSLGCTLYRMVAGRTPFTGTSPREIMRKQIQEEAAPVEQLVPEISAGLSEIIQTLMKKNPTDRYASSQELYLAFESLREENKTKESKRISGKKRITGERKHISAHNTTKRIKLAPAPAPSSSVSTPKRSVSRVRRSRKEHSNTVIYLPFGGFVLVIIILFWMGVFSITPDPAIGIYKEALRMQERGEFREAEKLLKLRGNTADQALYNKIVDLERDLHIAALGKKTRKEFNRQMREVDDLRASGASVKELRDKLLTLKEYWDRTDFEAEVNAELKKYRPPAKSRRKNKGKKGRR